ncbi:MAG: hypothetical protein EOO61_12970 [Hymenobacter sp.]|nr:MAG: hypothetical protein EOO61_12970 [Hymenobacter sp.]
MLNAGRHKLSKVLCLLLLLLNSCYASDRQQPTGLASIVRQLVFSQFCHSEDDRATEIGIKYQNVPDTIHYVLLPTPAANSSRSQTGLESAIKRGLAQHAFDTTRLENYKISYATAPLVAQDFTFHLCNGELYAHVSPLTQPVSLSATPATLVLSTPINLTRDLQLRYYSFEQDHSGSDGFVVIRNGQSAFPEVVISQTMTIYN